MINAYAESGDVDSALVGRLHWVWVGSLLILAFSHKLEQLEKTSRQVLVARPRNGSEKQRSLVLKLYNLSKPS